MGAIPPPRCHLHIAPFTVSLMSLGSRRQIKDRTFVLLVVESDTRLMSNRPRLLCISALPLLWENIVGVRFRKNGDDVKYPSLEGDGLVRKWLLTAAAKQVKRETSLDKFRVVLPPKRLKSTELPGRGSPQDVVDTSLVCFLSGRQWRRDNTHFPHEKPLRASLAVLVKNGAP
jgi:hypothetical protein